MQALQNITDPALRESTAAQLAQEGYTIDYQIMVAGWDPLNTMATRAFYGYTWVPSMLQPGVPVVPGMHLAGLPDYDPSNPPAGSVKVSTAFAVGKTVPSWVPYHGVPDPTGGASTSTATA